MMAKNPSTARTPLKLEKKGRPSKLTTEHRAMLRALSLSDPHRPLTELTTQFVAQSGVEVCTATVREALKKLGIERVKVKRASSSTVNADPKRYGYTSAHRREGPGYPSRLTDSEWNLIGDIFEERRGAGRPPTVSRREIVDACSYVVRSGCAWRMLPKDFPQWENVYAHFRRWAAAGLFEKMHDRLRQLWREREHRNVEPTGAIIDSQSVKTSEQGGPKGYDAGKKVVGRKRHIVTDTLGLLLGVLVHTADIQDRDGAIPLLDATIEKYPTIEKVYADSAYAGKHAKELKQRHDVDLEVVKRPMTKWHDKQLPLLPEPAFVVLPKRWVVERTLAWNSRPRRSAKDHDRRIDVATAWIWFNEAGVLLRRVAAANAGQPISA